MGKLYGSSVPLSQTFSPILNAPIDDRLAVSSYDDLETINAYKGLIVYVEDENTYYSYNKAADDSFVWQKASLGGSLSDDDGATLIGALRALLAEVVKMRNSFFYGMNSYTGRDTNPSVTLNEYNSENVEDEEPLWAVQESDLSEVFSMELDGNHDLIPAENVDISEQGKLKINGTAEVNLSKYLDGITDSKLFVYLTTTGLNVIITVRNLNTNEIKYVNLNKLQLSNTVYNYLFVLSRKLNHAGKQFISIVADNRYTDECLAEGYWNWDTLLDNYFDIQSDYTIQSISFTNLELSKFNIYSRYLDFNDSIVPTTYKPSDEKYKYKVAHLTIRSVETYEILDEIKNSLQQNELVFCEEKNSLYIKTSKNNIIKLGASSSDDDTDVPSTDNMKREDVLDILTEVGIVQNENDTLSLNDIADITFVNGDNRYLVTVDANGNVVSKKIITDTVYESIKGLYESTENNSVSEGHSDRGFIGRLGIQRSKEMNLDTIYKPTGNMGLFSDRVRIGAYYTPYKSNKVFGCSHCYVELENTSDYDIPLIDFYLHFCYPKQNADGSYELKVETLALDGILKGGSTFTVRGCAYPQTANTFVHINHYDQEWYTSNNTLIDLSLDKNAPSSFGWGFALTYCDAKMQENAKENTIITPYINANTVLATSATTYYGGYVDSIYIIRKWGDNTVWCPTSVICLPLANCITKNTFFLDPANQAYRALNSKDSNTVRWKNDKEFMYVDLSNEYIEFPASDEAYHVSMFAPKANKNVCTDKTLLDDDKPNMVTVSFGKNIHTTRCFNWISSGVFNEYVWIRKEGETIWNKFESYNVTNTVNEETPCSDNTATETYTESKVYYEYAPMTRVEFGYQHKVTKTVVGTGEQTQEVSEHVDSKGIYKSVYNRIINKFPANNTVYTSHKCIVCVQNQSSTGEPVKYEYIVGRADKNGQPHALHSSDIMYFTIYPDTYKPRIYQTTDQQGFHWIEYQPWAALAEELNKQILKETAEEHIIPIFMNTGDMTQNGTRVNEWLDYYNGGKCLFSHLEQMNVVGNNDLCRSDDPTILGTGDDYGKSSPYYFHVFYCYEIATGKVQGTDVEPIINGVYIPSLYYFGNQKYMYIMVNSELTEETCRTYFKLDNGSTFYNAYTGWMVPNTTADTYPSNLTWTPIYNMLYAILKDNTDKHIIFACHEMPFTVITRASLNTALATTFRNLSEKGALVGSHLNQISVNDTCHGIHWFSRLLEYFNIKLCIGGHKHTYSVTYPVRERYVYNGVDNFTNSSHPKMVMSSDLSNDLVTWEGSTYLHTQSTTASTATTVNLTKFPMVKRNDYNSTSGLTIFSPCSPVSDLEGGVVYFMLLASGNKLTSNKELPWSGQAFSEVLPLTTDSGGSDKASGDQQYPMYAVLEQDESEVKVSLTRLLNILSDAKHVFTQQQYGNGKITKQYLHKSSTPQGVWESTYNEENKYILKIS